MLPLADLAAATEAASGGVWDTGKWPQREANESVHVRGAS